MKIKQIPEDFIVDEALELKISKSKRDYSIIKLTKKGIETFKLMKLLSKILGVKQKFIGFAGLKDKNAVTTQFISLYKIPKEKIESLKIKDARIKFIGYAKNRINLGDLDGNNFRITLRDLEDKFKIPKNIQVENYFDKQRFGVDKNTHLVGRAIVKRDFNGACKILGLAADKNSIQELRRQPKRLLRFYVAAYQSYLWNKILAGIMSKKRNAVSYEYSIGKIFFSRSRIKNFRIPLINFDLEKDKYVKNIMNEEGIKKEDFIFRELPELISESQERDAFINVKKIKSRWGRDDLNKGKLKLEVSFFLPKGAYATMVLKKIEAIYSRQTKAF